MRPRSRRSRRRRRSRSPSTARACGASPTRSPSTATTYTAPPAATIQRSAAERSTRTYGPFLRRSRCGSFASPSGGIAVEQWRFDRDRHGRTRARSVAVALGDMFVDELQLRRLHDAWRRVCHAGRRVNSPALRRRGRSRRDSRDGAWLHVDGRARCCRRRRPLARASIAGFALMYEHADSGGVVRAQVAERPYDSGLAFCLSAGCASRAWASTPTTSCAARREATARRTRSSSGARLSRSRSGTSSPRSTRSARWRTARPRVAARDVARPSGVDRLPPLPRRRRVRTCRRPAGARRRPREVRPGRCRRYPRLRFPHAQDTRTMPTRVRVDRRPRRAAAPEACRRRAGHAGRVPAWRCHDVYAAEARPAVAEARRAPTAVPCAEPLTRGPSAPAGRIRAVRGRPDRRGRFPFTSSGDGHRRTRGERRPGEVDADDAPFGALRGVGLRRSRCVHEQPKRSSAATTASPVRAPRVRAAACVTPRAAARRPGRRRSRSRRGRGRRRCGAARAPSSPTMRAAARADRMAERDRAAVHVDALLVGAEHPRRVERDRRERLVDLDALHVVDRLAGLLERDARRPARACARGRRTRRRRTPCETIVASGSSPRRFANSSRRDDHARGAVVHARRVPGRRRPLRIEDGLERRRASRASCRGGRSRPPSTSPTGTISSAKRPASCAAAARWCERNAHASCSSREMPSSRATYEVCCDHVQLVEGRGEPVEDHRVDQRAVAEPVAEARLLEEVRRVRHRLHPAGDDELGVAGADHRVGDLDRADRRRAHLVDRVRRRLDRQPGADRRLPRRRLAGARLQHLAHDHVLGLVGLEADALERRPDRDRAELGRLVASRARRRACPNGVRTARDDDASGSRG